MTTELSHPTSIRNQTGVSYVRVAQEYLFAFFLSVLSTIVVLQIWKFKWLYVPFDYLGDSVFYAMTIKSLITTGWYLTDPSIGVPDGHFLGDFPTPEGLNYLILKMISLFSSNWALVFNLFFLLGFPLITVSALFVLRRFGLCYPFALTASVLFSFLPFRLIRGEGHAFLTAYYMTPLIIWLAAMLYQNSLFNDQTRQKRSLILYSLICILIGSNGVYNAFFGGFFMLLGSLIASYTSRKLQPLKYALLFIAIIAASITINVLPKIAYDLKHGKNFEAMSRPFIESEMYGLKIAQLLLPVDNDRIFSTMKQRYNDNSVSTNENMTATLGLIGGLGFLILIGYIFFKRRENSKILDALTHFNLSAVLLATIGGFSSLIAFFFLSGIRCYNRISVFIAFFALAAFFLFLQEKIKKSQVVWTISLVLLVLGLFNQSSSSCVLPPKMRKASRAYYNDRAFFQKVEQALPSGSRVFQLPYMSFPEGVGQFTRHMFSYDHFRAPLHSNSLKWSFGAMKGRKTDLWQRQTSSLDIPEMLTELARNGFTGLYIDRWGYADHGEAIEALLVELLNSAPITDKHRSFWDLSKFGHSQK